MQSMHSVNKKKCAAIDCIKAGTKRCSKCRSVVYCSVECQREHWIESHRMQCVAIPTIDAAVLSDRYRTFYKFSQGSQESLTLQTQNVEEIWSQLAELDGYMKKIRKKNWKDEKRRLMYQRLFGRIASLIGSLTIFHGWNAAETERKLRKMDMEIWLVAQPPSNLVIDGKLILRNNTTQTPKSEVQCHAGSKAYYWPFLMEFHRNPESNLLALENAGFTVINK